MKILISRYNSNEEEYLKYEESLSKFSFIQENTKKYFDELKNFSLKIMRLELELKLIQQMMKKIKKIPKLKKKNLLFIQSYLIMKIY